jgi:hypothetical protein
MFALNRLGARASRGARRLETALPIVFYLMDISDDTRVVRPARKRDDRRNQSRCISCILERFEPTGYQLGL